MALTVSDVHKALQEFCSDNNAGIGISEELFLHLLRTHIQRSVHLKGLPSNQKFAGFEVTFDVELKTPNIALDLHPHDGKSPLVSVNKFTAKLAATIDSKQICEIGIEFSELKAHLLLMNRKLKLKLINHNATETDFIKGWEKDQTVKSHFENNHKFEDKTWERLTHHFKAISIISTYEIAETFFDAIVFPDFFAIFRGITFGDNGHLEVNKENDKENDKENLVMFSASSALNFDPCPVDPVDGAIRLDASMSDGGKIKVIVNKDSPARFYRSDNHRGSEFNSERNSEFKLEDGHVFLYTPIQLLSTNFDGVVKPAVRISNSDSWGPFYYRWEITPGLKDQFSVSLDKEWPITFKIKAPLEVSGQAGAGIKIASVRHEAIGMMFDGKVDPFEIGFRIMLDWPRREILFESKVEDILAHDFHFTTSPLDFPLDKIFDVILTEVAKTIVNMQAGKILKATRIPIANLQLLEEVAKPFNGRVEKGLVGYSDRNDNVTIGVKCALPPN